MSLRDREWMVFDPKEPNPPRRLRRGTQKREDPKEHKNAPTGHPEGRTPKNRHAQLGLFANEQITQDIEALVEAVAVGGEADPEVGVSA